MTDAMIGRDAELAAVCAFLDQPAAGLRTLILEGEAGIGKSTLWLAGVAAARERSLRILVSRPAEAERTLPYVVLGDLFADADADALAQMEAPRRRAFESALLRSDADVPVDPRALGVAIRTLLPMLARPGGLVLAIDDDQWMDASSRATLEFALRRSHDEPILLLLSRRVDGRPARAFEEAIDAPDVKRIMVGALSVGAIQLLVRSRLGISSPRPMLLRLHEAAGGNPFYALELARARASDPSRDLAAPLAVPPSLERLLAARLEALAPPTQRALLLVAAQGRMPAGLLEALDVPEDALEAARAAQVIETATGIVSFIHPLLASAVYQGVSGDERRSAHRRLAMALEDPVERGRHLALASEAASATLAAELESAASLARDRGMALAAAELAEHALRLTPADATDDQQRRAIATARAYSAAGEGDRARSIAAGLVVTAQPGRRRAEGLILSAELARPSAALPLLLDALSESADIPELRAEIHAALAEAGRFMKGYAWAMPHAMASLRIAEQLDDDALRSDALARLALLRSDRGDPHALELAERAYRLAARLPDPRRLRWASWIVADVLMYSGVSGRARLWLESQLADWGDRDELVRAELLFYLANEEFWSGRWDTASELAGQALEISVEYGSEGPPDHLAPALVALHRGQFAVARDHARRGLSLAGGQLHPYHHAILAICDLWSGSPTASLADFIQAEETADARGWGEPFLRWWRADYAEALMQLGRLDDASRLVADWESAASRLGRARVLAQAIRCRGLIAAACDDITAALALLEDAVERHDAVGDPFGRSRALLALGVVRRRARQKRTARAALDAALAGFDALGASRWAATTRAELARIGGHRRIEGLSPSEHRVAELVVEGRTNREIAAALFLGERTVASHLSHIYAKLGIRSRTELARRPPQPMQPSPPGSPKIQPS